MISRREALRLLASTSATLSLAPIEVARARAAFSATASRATASQAPSERLFFTEREMGTVRLLADLLIPADERSGSATDAGVPEFIDFMMSEYEEQAVPIRGGLAWLEYECLDRFDHRFVDCSDSERTELLDEIAWPDRAPRRVRHGVAFFNRFRDLVASGFWSSKMGVEDLQYIGNVFAPRWEGCPPEQLQKLGLSD